MDQKNLDWQPLESNPEVLNTFMKKLGMKTDKYSFQELLSTQQWALQMIEKPTLGLILLYEQTPVQQQYKEQQAQSLDLEKVPKDIFFMKQYAGNACGTIALFHIVINLIYKKEEDIAQQNSFLLKFAEQSRQKTPQERGKKFQQSEELHQQHKQAVASGQSHIPQQIQSHFVALICKDGHLFEMDGCKKCPVDHGQCAPEDLLTKGITIVKKFMERDPDNLNFSTIVLAPNPT